MIPSAFKICGIDIAVESVPMESWHLYDPKHENQGLYFPDKGVIYIRDGLEGQQKQQTWIHEVVHVVLSTMNHPLNTDEAFVDLFASLLHQVLTTMESPKKVAKPRKK